VDTAVGIKLAKVHKGEAVSDIEERRMVKLKELVVKLVRSCKLLCPEGEQEFEYWGARLDDGIAKQFAELSRGIRILPHQAVHSSQAFIAMGPYLSGDPEFRLPSGIYFHTDPIQELRRISKQRVFASAHGLPPMLLELAKDSRQGMYTHCEE
jgi:hypothetical protein